VIWGPDRGVYIPDGAATWGLSLILALILVDLFTLEARVDRFGIILTRFGVWRRSRYWKDLTGIQDSRHYDYVLRFRGAPDMALPKHLVGMPGLLTFLGEVLDRNAARDARTAGSGNGAPGALAGAGRSAHRAG
jgi:hypothetical protein